MKIRDLISEGFFDKFKKKEPVKKPSKFPTRDDVDGWMDEQVAYFKKTMPDSLWVLFCPSSGDYIPRTVHAGISKEVMDKHLSHYRELKKQNPVAVSKALEQVNDYSIYNGGPSEDYPK